jgi:nucleoside-diphosphate kinase
MTELLAFNVEWLDPKSGITWPLQLTLNPREETVELFDTRAQRLFLKRTHMPQIKLEHLFAGASIVCLARTLRVLGCADAATLRRLDSLREPVFILVAAHALHFAGAVLDRAQNRADLTLVNAKLVSHLPAEDARRLSHDGGADQGPCLGFQLFSSSPYPGGAAEALSKALEPATFGYYVCGPAAASDVDHFFNASSTPASCLASGTSLAVVKPHLVHARKAGLVLAALLKAFHVTGCAVVKLDRTEAASFLAVYDGVVPAFPQMVEELTAGPALAIEVAPRETTNVSDSVVQQLRDLAGPADPELARVLRPGSLRSYFGIDTVRNGLHVTDLESDGDVETAAMFRMAQPASIRV